MGILPPQILILPAHCLLIPFMSIPASLQFRRRAKRLRHLKEMNFFLAFIALYFLETLVQENQHSHSNFATILQLGTQKGYLQGEKSLHQF